MGDVSVEKSDKRATRGEQQGGKQACEGEQAEVERTSEWAGSVR
jgi:hypothetical protein